MTSLPIARLALSNFIARRTRFALTILAVAISVALVVAITSGYASLERSIRVFVDDFIGSIDFEVTRSDDPRPAITPDVLSSLRTDKRVARVMPRIEVFATPVDERGVPIQPARAMLFGISDDPDAFGKTPRMDAGRFLKPGERDSIVVDQNMLDAMKAKLGDVVTFEGRDEPLKLTIVGVIHKPALMKMFFRSAYVSVEQLRQFVAPDRPGYVSKIRGEFAINVDSAAFETEWKERLHTLNEAYEFRLVRDNRAKLDQNLLGMRLASYLGSTVSLSAAAFIILASLMTGVQEQHRQLAMLRAIGATKWQVGRLVCFEGLCIGLAGAFIGIPAGIAGIYLLAAIYHDVFDNGVALAGSGMVYALIVAAGAALIASAIPAIWASRAKPLEAMSDATNEKRSGGLPWKAIIAGLVLVSIDSLIIFGPLAPIVHALTGGAGDERVREVRLFGHILVGIPTLLLGALFVAPLLVWLVERAGGAVLPGLFRLPAALLKQQLTESPWRSAATGVALMIGMMLLITMNAQGRSAMGAWQLPTRFPDVFIVPDAGYGALSIKPAEIDAIRKLPQVDKVMPISVTAPTLGAQIFDVAGTAMPDKTLFIGIDPAMAFDMMELDFRAGTEANAKRMMIGGHAFTLNDGSTLHATLDGENADVVNLTLLDGTQRTLKTSDIAKRERGRYLVVTEEFRKLRGYTVGDTFKLEAGLFVKREVPFVIVGVVWSPGMDVMLNTFDLPARVKEQTVATVFGTLEEGRESFGVKDAFLIAANLKIGVEKAQLLDQMRIALGREGLSVADIRELKYTIESVFKRLLMFASTVAWLAMAVASIGVGNAIVAGIRTRQWRLGVLRAIGLTRSELLRLLLAEALLLAIVGAVLGTLFGLLLSTNARRLYAAVIGFEPPHVIPWDLVVISSAVVIVLGLLATIVPAIQAARREPLGLLQAGRAAS